MALWFPIKSTPSPTWGVSGPHLGSLYFRRSIYFAGQESTSQSRTSSSLRANSDLLSKQPVPPHLTHLSLRAADGESSLLLSAVAEVCSETFLC